MNGLITVVMTAYNVSEYIRKTISSILSQSYKNLEIIIIDDGSTDGTRDILKEYTSMNNVRTIFREHTGNVGKNLNDCIRLSKGDVVAIMGADDLWVDKNKLELQMQSLRKYKIVCSYGNVIDANDKIIYDKPYNGCDHDIDTSELLKKNSIFSCSVLAYKDILYESGLFDESAGSRSEDYFLWLKISEKHSIRFISKVLISYRIHGNNLSVRSFSDKISLARRNIEIITPYLKSTQKKVADSARYGLNAIYNQLTKLYYKNGYYKDSSACSKMYMLNCKSKFSLKYLKSFLFFWYAKLRSQFNKKTAEFIQ